MNDGRELQLAVALADGRHAAIPYTWVAEFACDLSYPKDAGGAPLTWDVTYSRSGDRRAALCDFANQGSPGFTFADATYTEVDG